VLQYNRKETKEETKSEPKWYSGVTTQHKPEGKALCHGYGNTESILSSTDGKVLQEIWSDENIAAIQGGAQDGVPVGESI
jgi:hypothetical protein